MKEYLSLSSEGDFKLIGLIHQALHAPAIDDRIHPVVPGTLKISTRTILDGYASRY